jgi:hypothetical protein
MPFRSVDRVTRLGYNNEFIEKTEHHHHEQYLNNLPKSILSIKPDSEQAAPPQSHSLDGVSHASLLSLPGTMMSQLAFASAIDSWLEKSGGALHSNQSSPSVL